MRILANIVNVDGPTSDYPGGRIRNKDNTVSPAVVGTPIVEELYGDIIQFFQRLKVLGAITPNNLPDNTTNGYQLIEALLTVANDLINATSATLITKIVESGDWDMFNSSELIIPNTTIGISDLLKIRKIDIVILNNSGGDTRFLNGLDSILYEMSGGVISITSTNLRIGRKAGSLFDNYTEYGGAGFNRAYLTIQYLP